MTEPTARRDESLARILAEATQSFLGGDIGTAERLCLSVAAPDHPELLQLLGLIADRKGDGKAAVERLRAAAAADPGNANYRYNLGVILQKWGDLDGAAAAWAEALRLAPDHADALYNLANAEKARGRIEEAVERYRRVLEIRPDFAEAHNNLGNALQALSRHEDAADAYRRAVALKPTFAQAHNNLAAALRQLGRAGDALASLDKALTLQPAYAEAHKNRGAALQDLGRLEDAVAAFRQAIALAPTHIETYGDLGTTLASLGRLDEARDAYRQALALKPDAGLRIRLATLLPAVYDSVAEIEETRQRYSANLDDLLTEDLRLAAPETEVGHTQFYLAYQGLNDRALQEKAARLYLRACPSLDWTAPHCLAPRQARKRLRVGFVSRHLYEHTIGKLNRGLIAHLDRAKFETVVMQLPSPADATATAIAASADRAVRLPAKLTDARRMIAEAELDILFYPDIGMEPMTYFLGFARLAPVQIVTWGHPITTALPHMDYFLSSRDLEPEGAEDHYTEKLLRPNSPIVYFHRPPLPSHPRGRAWLQVPDGATLYACPQSLFKLHPDFDAMIGGILARDANARILFIQDRTAHQAKRLRERFARAFPDAVDRIIFTPQLKLADFLDLLRAADVVLDPPHFGGGNTSLEAFAMGAPIVTLPGGFLRSRITYAFYRKMGMTELIADSSASYIDIAVRLGTDAAWREQMRKKITERSAVLYEDAQMVRDLETLLLEAAAPAGSPK